MGWMDIDRMRRERLDSDLQGFSQNLHRDWLLNMESIWSHIILFLLALLNSSCTAWDDGSETVLSCDLLSRRTSQSMLLSRLHPLSLSPLNKLRVSLFVVLFFKCNSVQSTSNPTSKLRRREGRGLFLVVNDFDSSLQELWLQMALLSPHRFPPNLHSPRLNVVVGVKMW